MNARVAAVDLGASSGRVMVGEVGPDTLQLQAAARFANEPVRLPDGLHWNLPGLYTEVLGGLRKAAADGPVVSVGVDTWAVDYGLLSQGRLLGLPFHYRDETRGEAGPAAVHRRTPHADLYRRNGLQFLPFNTLYQLAADSWVSQADRILLVPDLIGYWLTGAEVAERTNASTTGLLDVTTGQWDHDLARSVGVPSGALAPLVAPGTEIGELLPAVAATVGKNLRVVAVGSHDTASAVVGVPMQTDDAAYLSLGTWGLVGLELDHPVLGDEARAANFTNEGGVDGRVRFLTNVMGTWLLSETLRTWSEANEIGDPQAELPGLLTAASEVTDPVPVVDVQDPRFVPPGDMPSRIAAWCAERDVEAPSGKPAMVRCIVDSLAAAYAEAFAWAASLAGRNVEVLHVVGGGARNQLLCQAIADRAGMPVLAGPVEATALGNVLLQARVAGAIGPELEDLRSLVARTHDVRRFEPRRATAVRDRTWA